MLSGLPQAWACPQLNGENSETASEFNQAAKRGKRTMHGFKAFRLDYLHSSLKMPMLFPESHFVHLGCVLQWSQCLLGAQCLRLCQWGSRPSWRVRRMRASPSPNTSGSATKRRSPWTPRAALSSLTRPTCWTAIRACWWASGEMGDGIF